MFKHYQHPWIYQGFIKNFFGDNSLEVSIDLGFHTWRNMRIYFNRIAFKRDNHSIEKGIPDLLLDIENRSILLRVFKNGDHVRGVRFFAEIFAEPEHIKCIKLQDLNLNLNSTFRIEGLININDLLVSHGFAYYVFEKKDKFPVHNGPARQNPSLRSSMEKSTRIKSFDNPYWGRSATEDTASDNKKSGEISESVFKGILPEGSES